MRGEFIAVWSETWNEVGQRLVDRIRDLVSMSILLAGFTPYLSDQLDVEALYSGA